MKNSKELKIYKTLTAVLVLALLASLAYIFAPTEVYTKAASVALPELSTDGFVKANVTADVLDQNTATLTLSDPCYELSAGVEPTMADSILNAIDNQVGPRPNAHDLAKDVFNALKINVLMVKITERRDSMYLGKIVLRQGNTILNYDVRPSDGIAIGLRMNAPIYINQTLLHTEGKNVC